MGSWVYIRRNEGQDGGRFAKRQLDQGHSSSQESRLLSTRWLAILLNQGQILSSIGFLLLKSQGFAKNVLVSGVLHPLFCSRSGSSSPGNAGLPLSFPPGSQLSHLTLHHPTHSASTILLRLFLQNSDHPDFPFLFYYSLPRGIFSIAF